MDKSTKLKKMSNKEAQTILKKAYNDDLLCICGALFDEQSINDCLQALIMASIALDYAPEILEIDFDANATKNNFLYRR